MTNQENDLHARVAWAYYQENMTQAEIAKRLDMTRSRVNKILRTCLETGLVQIVINSAATGCADAEHHLESEFDLFKAIVVPTPKEEIKLYNAIGKAAGAYVSENLKDGQTLGLGWGTTLRASSQSLIYRDPGNIAIVSLFGGLPGSSTTNPYDVASEFSRKLSAKDCYYIAAPMYVRNELVKETLMTQPMFDSIFNRIADVDMALIGSGDLTNRSTNVKFAAFTREEWRSLLSIGAIGEIFGYFINEEGELVDHPLNKRIMAADLDKLKGIPIKIIAAGGMHKLPLLRAILKGGYVDILVTDEFTAKAITP